MYTHNTLGSSTTLSEPLGNWPMAKLPMCWPCHGPVPQPAHMHVKAHALTHTWHPVRLLAALSIARGPTCARLCTCLARLAAMRGPASAHLSACLVKLATACCLAVTCPCAYPCAHPYIQPWTAWPCACPSALCPHSRPCATCPCAHLSPPHPCQRLGPSLDHATQGTAPARAMKTSQ